MTAVTYKLDSNEIKTKYSNLLNSLMGFRKEIGDVYTVLSINLKIHNKYECIELINLIKYTDSLVKDCIGKIRSLQSYFVDEDNFVTLNLIMEDFFSLIRAQIDRILDLYKKLIVKKLRSYIGKKILLKIYFSYFKKIYEKENQIIEFKLNYLYYLTTTRNW